MAWWGHRDRIAHGANHLQVTFGLLTYSDALPDFQMPACTLRPLHLLRETVRQTCLPTFYRLVNQAWESSVKPALVIDVCEKGRKEQETRTLPLGRLGARKEFLDS